MPKKKITPRTTQLLNGRKKRRIEGGDGGVVLTEEGENGGENLDVSTRSERKLQFTEQFQQDVAEDETTTECCITDGRTIVDVNAIEDLIGDFSCPEVSE